MFYSTAEMSAIFSRESHIRSILRFESALATAQARAGIVPDAAARAIARGCESLPFDADELFADAVKSGTLAIPLVKALTSHVDAGAGAYVHWGATSQDAIDTGFMLQSQSARQVLERSMLRTSDRCAELAREHRGTPMIARTLTQQALPITFGLKSARWLGMFTRQIERLQGVSSRVHVIQLGGAVGTLASLGTDGTAVRQYLAEALALNVPDLPWHTERDRLVELASTIGTIAGCVEKVAGDLLLLAQSEIGEVSERAEAGKGGSSTMPHKRNPVDLIGASAAARLATESVSGFFAGMGQEHERSAGSWQAEWERLPKLYEYTAYALERLESALDGLDVHPDCMRTNLHLSRGLIMAESLAMTLAERIGRIEAYRLVNAASARVLDTGRSMREVSMEDEEITSTLSPQEIERVLDPANYLGSTGAFIDSALDSYTTLKQRRPVR